MAVAVALAAVWWMGLGNGGDGDGPSIPIPQQNFSVTVTDTQGKSLKANRFTWEGKVHFEGMFGNARITLPFQKLKSVKVFSGKKLSNPDLIAASVTTKSGETVELSLERTSKCYGKTRFGNYEIFFKDVGEIVFN